MLELVQVWAEGLRSFPFRPQNNFLRTFSQLKNRGVRFPATSVKYNPPTPQVKPEEEPIPPELLDPHVASISQMPSLSGEDMERFSLVQSHIELLTDIFYNFDPKVENIRTNEIVNELLPSLSEFSGKLRFRIESGKMPEEIFAFAIDLNDKIVLLQQQHQELLQGKKPVINRGIPSKPAPKVTAFDLISQPAAPSSSSSANFLNLPAPPSPSKSPIPAASPADFEDDLMAEFASLANRDPPRNTSSSSSASSQVSQTRPYVYGKDESLI